MNSNPSKHRNSSLDFLPQAREFGRSGRGLPLEWLACSGDCEVFVIAGIHGEEPETTVILSRALRCLKEPLKSVACVLAANPDGLLRGTRGNGNGVDLNRNFPTEDWQSDPVRYWWHLEESADIEIRTGNEPASEPETRALLSLIGKLEPGFILALHAPLACIDDPDDTRIGHWLAEKTGLPRVRDVGYPTLGSLGTWAMEQKIPLVTWEFPRESIEELSRDYGPVLIDFLEKAEAGGFESV